MKKDQKKKGCILFFNPMPLSVTVETNLTDIYSSFLLIMNYQLITIVQISFVILKLIMSV